MCNIFEKLYKTCIVLAITIIRMLIISDKCLRSVEVQWDKTVQEMYLQSRESLFCI